MKDSTVSRMRCPRCGAGLALAEVHARDRHEITEGSLACGQCASAFAIRAGVAQMIREAEDLDEGKRREIEGWKRITRTGDFPDNWEELLLLMPNVPSHADGTGYWRLASLSFPVAQALLAPLAGKSVLELGAAYGWASRRFAELGADAVATDINDDTWAGLGKARFYIENGAPPFDRVRCDSERLPFGNEAFDHVFCSSVLHHFERPARVLLEAARVLKPGGSFIAINEAFHPAWPFGKAKWDDLSGIVKQSLELGINEQTFTHNQYRSFIRSAGLVFEAYLVRWDAVESEGGVRVGKNAAVKDSGHLSVRLSEGRWSGLNKYLPLERLMRLAPVAATARFLAIHYTTAYRVLVGRKPATS